MNNHGDTYTVEPQVFEQTRSSICLGQYVKSLPIWARKAEQDGSITTQGGKTHYKAGDMTVFNNEDETNGNAVDARTFDHLYGEDTSSS